MLRHRAASQPSSAGLPPNVERHPDRDSGGAGGAGHAATTMASGAMAVRSRAKLASPATLSRMLAPPGPTSTRLPAAARSAPLGREQLVPQRVEAVERLARLRASVRSGASARAASQMPAATGKRFFGGEEMVQDRARSRRVHPWPRSHWRCQSPRRSSTSLPLRRRLLLPSVSSTATSAPAHSRRRRRPRGRPPAHRKGASGDAGACRRRCRQHGIVPGARTPVALRPNRQTARSGMEHGRGCGHRGPPLPAGCTEACDRVPGAVAGVLCACVYDDPHSAPGTAWRDRLGRGGGIGRGVRRPGHRAGRCFEPRPRAAGGEATGPGVRPGASPARAPGAGTGGQEAGTRLRRVTRFIAHLRTSAPRQGASG